MNVGALGRLDDALVVDRGETVLQTSNRLSNTHGDVLDDGRVEEYRLLLHQRHRIAHVTQMQRLVRHPVELLQSLSATY